MPEANVLYAVTAVVIAGLVAWVAFVLKTAKEPWARPVSAAAAARARTPDVPIEKPIENEGEEPSDEKAADEAEDEAEAKDEAESKDEADEESAEDDAAKTDAKA